MRRIRIGGAMGAMFALALAAGPAFAQDAANNSATEVIGPPQISNFSLNGTVTRPATPTPVPAQPTRTQPAPAPDRVPSARPAQPAARSSGPTQQPSASVTVDLPPPTPAEPGPAFSGLAADPPTALPPPFVPDPAGSGDSFAFWPWLLAVAAAGGAVLFLSRRRRRHSYAGAGAAFEADAAAAEPLARAPAPAPAPRPRATPPAPASSGIVSTRLRPWLDIELLPERAVIDKAGATIQFEVAVRNSGSAPARDVLIEACMFNAGPKQDEEIGAFFAFPVGKGDRLEAILPLQQIRLQSSVRLSPEQMRQYEIEGRKLFVPLMAVNALYQWSGGRGQTSASYMVGRESEGDKMAPFRLDLGPRLFRGLGARLHSVQVRK